ncbi:hypothetical protein [Syntrophus aciditrophicus]|nr:hypothetical protein [Syntrophus aciditrophicus]
MIMDKAGGSGERRFLKRDWLGTVSVDCPEGHAESRKEALRVAVIRRLPLPANGRQRQRYRH